MGSQTSGQKTAKRFTNQAVNTLGTAQQDLLGSDLYQGSLADILGLIQNPLSMSPDVVNNLKMNNEISARQAYDTARNAADARAAASTGFRSGPARDAERYNSMRLADSISSGNRQIETQAALQRNPDIINALAAAMPYLQLPLQIPSQQAQILGGFATSPILGQPSPTSQALGGIGQLGGSVLGNAGLFKSGG